MQKSKPMVDHVVKSAPTKPTLDNRRNSATCRSSQLEGSFETEQ